jgi:hypothetical protein
VNGNLALATERADPAQHAELTRLLGNPELDDGLTEMSFAGTQRVS